MRAAVRSAPGFGRQPARRPDRDDREERHARRRPRRPARAPDRPLVASRQGRPGESRVRATFQAASLSCRPPRRRAPRPIMPRPRYRPHADFLHPHGRPVWGGGPAKTTTCRGEVGPRLENRYPGARCDIESMRLLLRVLATSSQQEWDWSERYATQPEILGYAQARRRSLRPAARHPVRHARHRPRFDEAAGRWTVRTDRATRCRRGPASWRPGACRRRSMPGLPGRRLVRGPEYHTGRWPHEGVDFTGQRVGVIGTGSSGIQSIPIIAEQAAAPHRLPAHAELHRARAQRARSTRTRARRSRPTTPSSARRPSDARRFGVPLARDEQSALEVAPRGARSASTRPRWEQGGLAVPRRVHRPADRPEANDTAAEFVRAQIREIVEDPEVAELLCPTTTRSARKRLCVDTGYYATFNRDRRAPRRPARDPDRGDHPAGLRTVGRAYELDAIVFATGFDAMTGALLRIDIRGRDGATLRETWEAGPAHVPRPGDRRLPEPLHRSPARAAPRCSATCSCRSSSTSSGSPTASRYLREHGLGSIEADGRGRRTTGSTHVNVVADFTLFPPANSWYLGANVPGQAARVHAAARLPPDLPRSAAPVAEKGYEGFALTPAGAPVRAGGNRRGAGRRERPAAPRAPGPSPLDRLASSPNVMSYAVPLTRTALPWSGSCATRW